MAFPVPGVAQLSDITSIQPRAALTLAVAVFTV